MKKVSFLILLLIFISLVSCSHFYNDLTENIKQTEYTVEHYRQTVDGKGYELEKSDTKKLSGTANTKTSANANKYTGFTAKSFNQQNINPDGSTKIKIYYDRKIINLSFDFAGGLDDEGKQKVQIKGLYGAEVTAPVFNRRGYTFASWNPVLPENFPEKDTSYSVLWKEGTTIYTVHHYLQNLDGEGYEEVSEDLQTIGGITNSDTDAKANIYTGFTANQIEQKQIAADGSTVIDVFYNRNKITYTFNSDTGAWSNNLTTKTTSGLYGAPVQTPENPLRTGYTFAAWDSAVPKIYGTENRNFTASWLANSDTPYKVEHWLQNINDDNYTKVESDTQLLTGTTTGTTVAVSKDYTGFSLKELSQDSIAADGSTVIKIYYDRNTTSYTFTSDGGKWNDNSQKRIVSGRYGASVSIPSEPEKTGYTFSNWNASIPQSFGTENISFSAVWQANTNTPYIVEHWQQNTVDDNYTKVDADTQPMTGTTATNTNASANSYIGFTPKTIEQETIAADGSTCVKIYYDRDIITYTFHAADGNWGEGISTKTVSGRFGACITSSVEVPDSNYSAYIFDKWSDVIPDTFISENKDFTASYKYNYYEKVTPLPKGTDGSLGTEGNYVYFGIWPRSEKDELVNVDEGQSITMGGHVYFSGDDRNLYYKQNGTYYKVEPLKWRVITRDYNDTGNALLLCENYVEKIPFYKYEYEKANSVKAYTNSTRRINNKIIYANNYKYSTVRAFLNGKYEEEDTQNKEFTGVGFLQTAFTQNAQDDIKITEVDNSELSTHPTKISDSYNSYWSGTNPNWCENTNDKIFLLSIREATNNNFVFGPGGITDDNRVRKSILQPEKPGWWWLRSPCSNRSSNSPLAYIQMQDISGAGNTSNGSSRAYQLEGSVVPALTISLED